MRPVILALLVWAFAGGSVAHGQAAGCHFQLGFATLHEALPAQIGQCLEDESYAANGDSLQHATGGLLAWRKSDNLAAFTDGFHTWVLGPSGVQERLNSERFAFEHDQPSLPQLKFRLLDSFGPLLYCDPDFYPVARADELSQALAHFPEIQGDAVLFRALLAHRGLSATAELSPAQKLAVYRDFKMIRALVLQPLADGSFGFNAQFGTDVRAGMRIAGSIDAQGSIAISSNTPAPFLNCPICLARGTLIDTPSGPIAVEELRPGMPVWTLDSAERRRPAVVLETGQTPVPPEHQVVRLVLDDGREVLASPSHPLVDGRPVGSLQPGDSVGGARVISAVFEPYTGGYTFDLLPSGDTGVYFAGGISLRSTLKARRAMEGTLALDVS